jgi:hypothetical protein
MEKGKAKFFWALAIHRPTRVTYFDLDTSDPGARR